MFGEPNPIVLTQEQMNAINQLEIPGVFAVEKHFDRKITPAAQLIGVLGENPEELKKRYPDKGYSDFYDDRDFWVTEKF